MAFRCWDDLGERGFPPHLFHRVKPCCFGQKSAGQGKLYSKNTKCKSSLSSLQMDVVWSVDQISVVNLSNERVERN